MAPELPDPEDPDTGLLGDIVMFGVATVLLLAGLWSSGLIG